MKDDEFEARNHQFVAAMGEERSLHELGMKFIADTVKHEYSYHFRWLGLPIIQYPQDVVAMQELIWKLEPDAIVETGVARGGSLILSASILHLLDKGGVVVGVDIDIRPHNREAIESHRLARYIKLVQGSSTAADVIAQVKQHIAGAKRVLVILDSMHSHAHVLEELKLYAPLVTKGSYLVVMDSVVEMLPKELYPDRPWGPGDNPWTATQEYLKTTDRFEIDRSIPDKLMITVAPDGYLRCVKD